MKYGKIIFKRVLLFKVYFNESIAFQFFFWLKTTTKSEFSFYFLLTILFLFIEWLFCAMMGASQNDRRLASVRPNFKKKTWEWIYFIRSGKSIMMNHIHKGRYKLHRYLIRQKMMTNHIQEGRCNLRIFFLIMVFSPRS